MVKQTKDWIEQRWGEPKAIFFEQTMQEVIAGNLSAINKKEPAYGYTVLYSAFCSDNKPLFEKLLRLKPHLNQVDNQGYTFLMQVILTVQPDQLYFTKLILSQLTKADLNKKNARGQTAQDLATELKNNTTPAAKPGYEQIIQALKDKEQGTST